MTAYDPFLPAAQRLPVRLEEPGLVLREWTDADVAAMPALFDDPAVALRTPLPSPFGLPEARARVARAREGDRLLLAITVDGDEPCGEVLLLPDGTLGYVLGPAHRGRGLASRALRLLADHAAGVLAMPLLRLEIEPDNAASAAVARRAGFTPTAAAPHTAEDKGRTLLLALWERRSAA